MTTLTLTYTADLKDEDLDYIAITAIEGGIGYWSKVDLDTKFRQGETYLGTPVYVPFDDIEEVGLVNMTATEFPCATAAFGALSKWKGEIPTEFVLESFAEANKWVLVGRVDQETLTRGIKHVLETNCIRTDLLDQVRTIFTDDIDIDADAADCILQAGIFGQVVYG